MKPLIGNIQQEKIGQLLSQWSDTLTYRYGDNQVIKFSKWNDRFPDKAFQKRFERDYEIAQRYLGHFVIPTQFIPRLNKNGRHSFARIQEYVSGEPLTYEDLSNPITRKKFEEFSKKYRELIDATVYEMDLIGHEGIFKGALGNIFVTEENTLRIFDTTLFDSSGFGKWAWLWAWSMDIVIFFAKHRQHRVIEKFTKCISEKDL